MIDAEVLNDVFAFVRASSEASTPTELLAGLETAVHQGAVPVSGLGIARLPILSRDWSSTRLGFSAFLGPTAPAGWWDEYISVSRMRLDQDLMMARTSLAPFTWTESRKMLEPIGVDRWPYDLALQFGMRDGLSCPIGNRWLVVYWSKRVLNGVLSDAQRALLFMAANCTAIRLEQIAPGDPNRLPQIARLTAREVSVLRYAAMGKPAAEIAELLEIGEETVRSHFKKAQDKLGARNRTQATAEAIRRNLIP